MYLGVSSERTVRHQITLTVNGETEFLEVESHRTLLQVLREDLGLTGTKDGCNSGECGACTVLFDGEPVNACLILAVEADEHEVVTIEGLTQDGTLDPLQRAFINRNAVQCGFCTPGMIISAKALLNRNPRPSEMEIRQAIAGNLCRCTGYTRIVEAVQEVTKCI
jgi:carbon-monoxide dehydrogenase small subunit